MVDIAGCFDDYERGLSRNRRKSLRRGRRQLEAQGERELRRPRGPRRPRRAPRGGASRSRPPAGRARAAPRSPRSPHTRGFYTEVARWAADRGWLRLAFLRLDGRAIACDYSIAFDGAWYSLKAGYDERYRAYGPGALLLREQLRHCFEHGLSRLELLGTEDPFKLSWADRSCDRSRVHAFDRTLPGLAALLARRRARAACAPRSSGSRSASATSWPAGTTSSPRPLALWDRLGLEAQAVAL